MHYQEKVIVIEVHVGCVLAIVLMFSVGIGNCIIHTTMKWEWNEGMQFQGV